MEFDWTKFELKIVLGALAEIQDVMNAQLKILLKWVDNKENEAYRLAEETNRLYKTVFKRLYNDYADKLN